MNLKDKKGSISIFVLIMFLFMSAFLIILYAGNVNKSKVVKEQFNIISDIYAYGGGDQGAYDKAYTDLRQKNKQTMTASVENTGTLELTKTFNENMSNYRIYGNSVQDGTPSPTIPVEIQNVGDLTSNLFNCENVTLQSGANSYINANRNDNKFEFSVKSDAGGGAAYGYQYTYEVSTDMIGTSMYISAKFKETGNSNFAVLCDAYNGNTYLKRVATIGSFTNRGGTFTIPENTTKIIFRPVLIFSETSTLDDTGVIWDIMLNYGDAMEYEPYGKYKIPVKVSTNNLLDYNNFVNEIWINKDTAIALYKINLPNGTYTVSTDIPANAENYNSAGVFAYTEIPTSYNTATGGVSKDSPRTIVVENKEIYIGFYKEGNGTTSSYGRFFTIDEFKNGDFYIQIQEGESDTDYVNSEIQTFNIYLDEPLRKAGDYADYIDFENGKLVRNVGIIEVNGDEGWINEIVNSRDNDETMYFYSNLPVESVKKDLTITKTNGVSTRIEATSINKIWSTSTVDDGIGIVSNTNGFRCRIKKSRLNEATAAGLNQWLQENPFEFYYPIIEKEEVIGLQQLKSYEDYTKIEVLTNAAPSKIEVEYEGYTLD